jgi:hypothetical protein
MTSVASAAAIEALIEKYNRLAANETARFCRAQDVADDLRGLLHPASDCGAPACPLCIAAAGRILDDLRPHILPPGGQP